MRRTLAFVFVSFAAFAAYCGEVEFKIGEVEYKIDERSPLIFDRYLADEGDVVYFKGELEI